MTTQNAATDPSQMQAEELLSFLEDGGTLKMLHDVSADTIEHIYAVGYNFFQSGKVERVAKVFQLLSMLDHYQARFLLVWEPLVRNWVSTCRRLTPTATLRLWILMIHAHLSTLQNVTLSLSN